MYDFPRPYMKQRELVRMGIPIALLQKAYGTKGQRIAQKIHPDKKNSSIIYNTELLGEWMEKEIRIQNLAKTRR